MIRKSIFIVSLLSSLPSYAFFGINCVANPFQAGCSPIPAPTNDIAGNEALKKINELDLKSLENLFKQFQNNENKLNVLSSVKSPIQNEVNFNFYNSTPLIENELTNKVNDYTALESEQRESYLSKRVVHLATKWNDQAIDRRKKLEENAILSLSQADTEKMQGQTFLSMQLDTNYIDKTLLGIIENAPLKEAEFQKKVMDGWQKVNLEHINPPPLEWAKREENISYKEFVSLKKEYNSFVSLNNWFLVNERFNAQNQKLEQIIAFHEELKTARNKIYAWFEQNVEKTGVDYVNKLNLADNTSYIDTDIKYNMSVNTAPIGIPDILKYYIAHESALYCLKKPENGINYPHSKFEDINIYQINYDPVPLPDNTTQKLSENQNYTLPKSLCYEKIVLKGFEYLELRKLEEWWRPIRETSEQTLSANKTKQAEIREKWGDAVEDFDYFSSIQLSFLAELQSYQGEYLENVSVWANEIEKTIANPSRLDTVF